MPPTAGTTVLSACGLGNVAKGLVANRVQNPCVVPPLIFLQRLDLEGFA